MRLTPKVKILLFCLLASSLLMLLFGIYPINPSCNCNCDQKDQEKNILNIDNKDEAEWGTHSLCIIVPFRDRLDELLEFAPHMNRFLNKQHVRHRIFVINQVDQHRFNRASLINVGFLESEGACDYIAMHDVDLMPLNDALKYSYPENGPFHIASPNLHPRYHYKTFVGGILLLQREHFLKINGLSNRYWGWGLEDDEFYVRMKNAGLTVSRPVGISTGTKNTFLHLHDRNKRKRDTAKLYNQKEVTRRRDRITGLDTVKYKLIKKYEVNIEGASVNILNVELTCDHAQTPWCDSTQEGTKTQPKTSNKTT